MKKFQSFFLMLLINVKTKREISLNFYGLLRMYELYKYKKHNFELATMDLFIYEKVLFRRGFFLKMKFDINT